MCERVDCGALAGSLERVDVANCTNGTLWQSTCTARCQFGFDADANFTAVAPDAAAYECAADGTWEDVATVTFDDAGRPQSDVRRKLSFANKNVVCSKIKLSIDRSAADFSIVKSVRLLGVPACA